MTLGRRRVAELLGSHGLSASRRLGQNFVVEPGVVRRIVELAGVRPGDRVVEIGPGVGSLTLALVEAGACVVAVEKDGGLLPILDEVLSGADPAPVVVRGDALTIDWGALLGDSVGPPSAAPGAAGSWTLVANLPYNVAVPLIIEVLRTAPMIRSMVVMVQREVADRLRATPGGRVIGVPTVKVGWYAEVESLMEVSRQSFEPVPRVDSSVLRITRHDPPAGDDLAEVAFRLVDTAYRQRRKMLRSSLAGFADGSEMQAAGVEPTARPEQLSVGAWAALAEVVARRGG